MLYYVRRYILIRNFKPLQIIHFLIFFHKNWYKYVIFHAEFIFIHNFEKYSIVQKIMGKIQCQATVAIETHFLAGSNCVTTCFPQFLNSASIKYLICKFSCFYPEGIDIKTITIITILVELWVNLVFLAAILNSSFRQEVIV